MNPALATCAPGPPWLRCVSAVPTIWPASSTATKVRPGGSCSQLALARSSLVSRSQVNVSPAAITPRTMGQISGQSSSVASLISTI